MMSTFGKRDPNGFIGKHLIHTYDSSRNYGIYVKNGHALDYRIHSDVVGNRQVKDQEAYIMRIGESTYKISWTEPTGTNVSLIVNLGDKLFHSAILFPRWIMNNPEEAVYFQNDHIPLVNSYRDADPAHPAEATDKFVTITLIRDYGADNDEAINHPTSELPADFPANL